MMTYTMRAGSGEKMIWLERPHWMLGPSSLAVVTLKDDQLVGQPEPMNMIESNSGLEHSDTSMVPPGGVVTPRSMASRCLLPMGTSMFCVSAESGMNTSSACPVKPATPAPDQGATLVSDSNTPDGPSSSPLNATPPPTPQNCVPVAVGVTVDERVAHGVRLGVGMPVCEKDGVKLMLTELDGARERVRVRVRVGLRVTVALSLAPSVGDLLLVGRLEGVVEPEGLALGELEGLPEGLVDATAHAHDSE